jgi:UDP-N-acetylglucosamine 2-epimerase (non-hydrolysing)
MWAPYPEEMSRRLTDQLSSLHFAPTLQSKKNLLNEGISPESIFVTGNTVIDALQLVIKEYGLTAKTPESVHGTTILVTAHRRESFGQPLLNICQAIRLIATAKPEVTIVFPVHPNPEVNRTVLNELSEYDNIRLVDPLDYPSFIQLMLQSRLILSDSGGIQEEATVLGKPVLVLRTETDRPEAIERGHAKLVGIDPQQIFAATQNLLEDQDVYEEMSQPSDIYGNGQASRRILDIVKTYLLGGSGVGFQE